VANSQSSTPITISSIRTPRGQDLRSYIVLLVVLEFLRFPLPFRGGFSGAFHTASILLTTSFANGVIEIIENALRISHSNGRLLSQPKIEVRNGGRTEDLVGQCGNNAFSSYLAENSTDYRPREKLM